MIKEAANFLPERFLLLAVTAACFDDVITNWARLVSTDTDSFCAAEVGVVGAATSLAVGVTSSRPLAAESGVSERRRICTLSNFLTPLNTMRRKYV